MSSRVYHIVPTNHESDTSFMVACVESIGLKARALPYDMFAVEVPEGGSVTVSYYLLRGLLDDKFIEGLSYKDSYSERWEWLKRGER